MIRYADTDGNEPCLDADGGDYVFGLSIQSIKANMPCDTAMCVNLDRDSAAALIAQLQSWMDRTRETE